MPNEPNPQLEALKPPIQEAIDALERAKATNAPMEEIERLTREVDEARAQYFSAKAKSHRKAKPEQARTNPPAMMGRPANPARVGFTPGMSRP